MGKLKSQSGFTLTELLISVVIIAIGVVGFATAIGLASTELWMGLRDTEVSMLVHDQVEQLKALPYDSVASGVRDEGDYHLDWTVSGGSPKKVVLVAEYNRRNGGQRADTIVVYIPR
jgi:prepilin-type N-terminal cleavage/methylation domain-containing protein